jgi:hypothetical protein
MPKMQTNEDLHRHAIQLRHARDIPRKPLKGRGVSIDVTNQRFPILRLDDTEEEQ